MYLLAIWIFSFVCCLFMSLSMCDLPGSLLYSAWRALILWSKWVTLLKIGGVRVQLNDGELIGSEGFRLMVGKENDRNDKEKKRNEWIRRN